MDITDDDIDAVVCRDLHIDVDLLDASSSDKILPPHSLMTKGTQNIETIDISDDDEQVNDEELTVAEESVIHECLNDTEGSLSAVDLKVFDVLDERISPKSKKSMKKRISERQGYKFLKDKSDTSEDDANSEKPALSPNTMTELCKKYRARANFVIPLRTPVRRVKRMKTRSPENNTRINHVHSFFKAIADLVSTFSPQQVSRVKADVNSILMEMIRKVDRPGKVSGGSY